MTEISSVRRNDIDVNDTSHEAPTARRTPSLAELPANDQALALFVQNVTTAPVDARAQALDSFRDSFSGPYSVDGQSVPARPMFRMNDATSFNQAKMESHRQALSGICARAKVADSDVVACELGRCSPKQLVRVTQALIDAGKLPSGPGSTETRIRQLQWEWGIGVDCAGYTAQAAMAVHGVAAKPLLGNNADMFSKMTKDPQHFDRVPVGDVRSGDIIHLDPPSRGEVGHNVIVHDHTVNGSIHTFHVDSSWGAGDGQDVGGFRRDTWKYDESTKAWSYTNPTTHQRETSTRGPNDEPFTGAFRPKGAR